MQGMCPCQRVMCIRRRKWCRCDEGSWVPQKTSQHFFSETLLGSFFHHLPNFLIFSLGVFSFQLWLWLLCFLLVGLAKVQTTPQSLTCQSSSSFHLHGSSGRHVARLGPSKCQAARGPGRVRRETTGGIFKLDENDSRFVLFDAPPLLSQILRVYYFTLWLYLMVPI